MKREIKFRAWDMKFNRMNYKVQVGNTDYGDKNYTCNNIWVDYNDEKGVGWMHADDRCIDLMQFAGIKDKNGKDIYDGDFLSVRVKHGFNSELLREFKELKNLPTINGIGNHFIGIVRVDLLRGLMFENPENGYLEPMFTRHLNIEKNHSEIEVIGNIYENPELLQQ